MATPKTQQDYRRPVTATDQFGRKWNTVIEIATGDPCGAISPAGWTDPLKTPYKYLRVPREAGQPMWGRITVDFEGWVNDHQAAERDWKTRLWEIGQLKHGQAFDAEHAEENEYLVSLTGPKPWPSSMALLEAAAGNPALLGIAPLNKHAREMLNIVVFEDLVAATSGKVEEPETPVVAAPLKAVAPDAPIGGGGPTKYQDFVSEALKAGRAKNVKEAAALWRERKAAMAAAERGS